MTIARSGIASCAAIQTQVTRQSSDELRVDRSRNIPRSTDLNLVTAPFLASIADDLRRADLHCPTFIEAALGARIALKKTNLSPAELVHVVEREPLLSARVVGLANTAALRRTGKPVSSVKQAVLQVGENAVRNVAVSLALEQVTHSREMAPFRNEAHAIWAHSLEVAVLGHVLARHATGIDAEEALFVGLVHDIGYFYGMWRATQFPALTNGDMQVRALMRASHASVAARMLKSMGMADDLVQVVERHEDDPASSPPRSLAQLLSVANLCANHPAADANREPVTSAGLSEQSANALLADHFDEVTWLLAAIKG
jgi:putative nucleotidyltransferase with HDIG domain